MNVRQALLLIAAGALLGIGSCALLVWNPLGWGALDRLVGRNPEHSESEAAPHDPKALHTCAMHPQVLEDQPGQCPICGMNLVPVGEPTEPEPGPARRILYWRAPMDPIYTSDGPGKSPMGMDLVPVYEDEAASGNGVRVSRGFLQNFAVRTVEVVEGPLDLEIRTVGVLGHNEETVVSVNTKFDGWIENARVNNLGEMVSRGEVLFEIYSPSLVTTQQEFLVALEFVRKLRTSGADAAAVERAELLVEASRERLRNRDVPEQQIEAVESSGRVRRTVEFVSPAAGFIVDKMGDSLEGMRVAPGMTILKLADHSRLWVEAAFYEEHIRHLREGLPISVEVDAMPARTWDGRIVLFRPSLDPVSRTLAALVEIDNSDLALRPQMDAVVIARPSGVSKAVLVPEHSVLHSGKRAVVVVDRGGGLFEPREVDLGLLSNGLQQITSGLAPGERAVTSSQFLIDSESNLRAAIDQLLGDQPSTGGESAGSARAVPSETPE